MDSLTGIFTPLILHLAVTELAAAASAGRLDAAVRALLVSLIVLPAACAMYLSDRKKEGAHIGESVPPRTGTEKGAVLRSVGLCLFCFLAGGLMNLAWSRILVILQIRQHFSNDVQEALLSGKLALQIFSMGIFVPPAEELIFRGLIYRRMRRIFPAGRAIFLSSLLFAVYHGNMIQMVFAFPMSVALTLLYERSGKFRCPLLFHMGSNLTAVVVNYLM